jgi:tetratricopeptide (TPR) repeat protein
MSNDLDLDWLRYGLTDMLVTDLSQNRGTSVLSTDQLYKTLKEIEHLDDEITSAEVVEQIAEKANAENVILGSFMRVGDILRINLRIRQPDGQILASESVEGTEESLFAMVSDLSQRVRRALEIDQRAGSYPAERLEEVTTSSLRAYRHYVEGVRFLNRGEFELAIPQLERATKIDPEFAMAYAQLASAHVNVGHDEECLENLRQAYEKSNRLPEREKYYIEAMYYSMSGKRGRSLEQLRKLLEHFPGHDEARYQLAGLYLMYEQYPESIEHFEELRRRRFMSSNAYWSFAWAYVGLGHLKKPEVFFLTI